MEDASRAIRSPDEGEFFFRRCDAAEMADIHRESERLVQQAEEVRNQWCVAQMRMKHLQQEIARNRQNRWETMPGTPTGGMLWLEREAHDLTKLSLERELARGRQLEDEVLSIQDQERARLGRELHDGICQSLSAVTFMLEAHARHLDKPEPGSEPMRFVHKMRETLAGTIREMRSLSHELNGFEIAAQDGGLCGALRDLAARLNATESVRCVVVCPDLSALDSAKTGHLYRIVQEAVGNAIRHGQAGHVEICLAPVDGRWRLTVTDDGVGMPMDGLSNGSGLGTRSMKYRAAVLGGTLEVCRAHATEERPGTVVSCTFP